MNALLLCFPAQVALCLISLGQTSSRPFIAHALEVPDFVPPAPPVEKSVPNFRVEASVARPAELSRTLTLIRGEASTLPDIPQPVESPPESRTANDATFSPRQLRQHLSIGASVYDRRVSLASWWDPVTGQRYEALCGIDLSLLAGIGEFEHDGETISLILMHSAISSRFLPPSLRTIVPEASAFPEGRIVILEGDSENQEGTAPIRLLSDLIQNEQSRLIRFQQQRRAHQLAADAWNKAHPPQPRDETFWFRPHRGSRYLANPRPQSAAE